MYIHVAIKIAEGNLEKVHGTAVEDEEFIRLYRNCSNRHDLLHAISDGKR